MLLLELIAALKLIGSRGNRTTLSVITMHWRKLCMAGKRHLDCPSLCAYWATIHSDFSDERGQMLLHVVGEDDYKQEALLHQ
jgi:hypothetical protein